MQEDHLFMASAAEARPILAPPPDDDPVRDQVASAAATEAGMLQQRLREQGLADANSWELIPRGNVRSALEARWRRTDKAIEEIIRGLKSVPRSRLASDAVYILGNVRLLRKTSKSVGHTIPALGNLRMVERETGYTGSEKLPRVYLAAAGFLEAVNYRFSEASFVTYVDAVQDREPFDMAELWALKPMMDLRLLEAIAEESKSLISAVKYDAPLESSGEPGPVAPSHLSILISSLQKLSHAELRDAFHELSRTDAILRQDPAGAYERMDFESREIYREAVRKLARDSEAEEVAVAQTAVDLAKAALNEWKPESRVGQQRSHVGYYLVGRGRRILESQVHYRVPRFRGLGDILQSYPDIFYLLGVEILTFAVMAFALSGLRVGIPMLAAVLLLLLPASEAAVETINQIVTYLLPAHPLPKLDFSEGIPEDCTTIVAVPTLLIREDQIRQLVRDLEIRYLGNRDANLHFALLTDPPDSTQPFDEKDEELVRFCSQLIEDLNKKYGHEGRGTFFHFYRHRAYNSVESTWMGWERKRGKLLDFNHLLRGQYDRFPVKVGELSILPKVRYVITLDSDTQLPRETAHRLIGTLAHPLNRAIIDPATNAVVEGYGILQPRVGVSVRSANRSRLAFIYSGQTGLDTYTRAISDVYQDLFGEGIFTGKGIYEVDVFQRVLGERFPSNTILSHDLIEGAYARAGLVSDVEVIDDYPSHFSAHGRRKHRWVRGDWQILRWLFHRVPDGAGRLVANPLTVISRWKILDNLRRSMVESALFALLIAAWFFLPGSPAYWTSAAIALMLIPTYVGLVLGLSNLWRTDDPIGLLKGAAKSFIDGQIDVLLMFTFLAHQTLVTLDAVARTVVRITITHRNLLQWETAAQSEVKKKERNPVDRYLDWSPYLSIVIGIALAFYRPHALPVAVPFLLAWLFAKPIVGWLDRPVRAARTALTPQDEAVLRLAALKTWRYFEVFSIAEDNWLIPDHLEVGRGVMHRISPTNLGLLLDSQFAAYDLGFLTLPRFLEHCERTMKGAEGLERFRGHFLNWYDTRSRVPDEPRFVSSVDSGNLAACLWALKQGCLDTLNRSIFQKVPLGIRDHFGAAAELAHATEFPAESLQTIDSVLSRMYVLGEEPLAWLNAPWLEKIIDELVAATPAGEEGDEVRWWLGQTRTKLADLRRIPEEFAPWLQSDYTTFLEASLPNWAVISGKTLTLKDIGEVRADLERQLHLLMAEPGCPEEKRVRCAALLEELAASAVRIHDGIHRLRELARHAGQLVEEMDFRFLYNERRKFLTIGYDVSKQLLMDSCYDLLASEARSAVFVAIAKGDIPQESWLRLARSHTRYHNHAVLLSWTGTMFEYLMPTLWLKAYPDTLVDRNMSAAVASQQEAVTGLEVPWGISESSCSLRDDGGHYQYHAFGVKALALNSELPNRTVIAPYATFLALSVDPTGAMSNLRRMKENGWLGPYGFYESADFGPLAGGPGSSERAPRRSASNKTAQGQVVRNVMAHHQGMSLLAAANLLSDGVFQRMFHEEPMVAATERILHERVPVTLHLEQVHHVPVAADSDSDMDSDKGTADAPPNLVPAADISRESRAHS